MSLSPHLITHTHLPPACQTFKQTYRQTNHTADMICASRSLVHSLQAAEKRNRAASREVRSPSPSCAVAEVANKALLQSPLPLPLPHPPPPYHQLL